MSFGIQLMNPDGDALIDESFLSYRLYGEYTVTPAWQAGIDGTGIYFAAIALPASFDVLTGVAAVRNPSAYCAAEVVHTTGGDKAVWVYSESSGDVTVEVYVNMPPDTLDDYGLAIYSPAGSLVFSSHYPYLDCLSTPDVDGSGLFSSYGSVETRTFSNPDGKPVGVVFDPFNTVGSALGLAPYKSTLYYALAKVNSTTSISMKATRVTSSSAFPFSTTLINYGHSGKVPICGLG